MLRQLTSIVVAATICGCSVVPHSAWTFDGAHPPPRIAGDPARVVSLTDRVAQLQIELNGVRAKIAAQDDTSKRLPLYAQEHRIHRSLAPLQRELAQYASAR